jgi:hypothetical protein
VTRVLWHALTCCLLAALVLGVGLLLAGPESVPGVLAGTGIGLAFQVLVVGGLLAALFAGQPMVLFGLGMVGWMLGPLDLTPTKYVVFLWLTGLLTLG